jgi:cysteine-rich repeat protein
MSFIEQPLTYEMLQNSQFTSRSLTLVSSSPNAEGTAAQIFVEVSTNCAGNGRNLCRQGALCAANSDCESRHCLDDGDNHQTCQQLCGNGAPDSYLNVDSSDNPITAQEPCDDGNRLDCGSCNKTCTEAVAGAGCYGGIGCVTGADCDSGSCVNGACASRCGNGWLEAGEECDDGNTNGCGTCSATCASRTPNATACSTGTGCATGDDCLTGFCSDGFCADLCGDGTRGGSETCDDGNNLACGTCNYDCSANVSGTMCDSGTGCTSNQVCKSGSCVAGVCTDVCGDGTKGPSEACDDGNQNSCGTCGTTCAGAGAGTCDTGVGCNSGAVCTSGLCASGTCQPPAP